MAEQDPNTNPNYQYLKANWDRLLKEYPEKYVIISNREVVGFYDTYETAVLTAITDFKGKDFIVHHLTASKPLNFIFAA